MKLIENTFNMFEIYIIYTEYGVIIKFMTYKW